MKKYIFLFLVLLSFSGYAQNTINNYKYVIVPEKFGFLKQADQYNLNSRAKGLLEDKGFTVYFDNAELPAEIFNNKCNALNFDILEKNSMFSTNLTIVLKDCRGNVIFTGKQGKSREKEFELSYNLALKDAFVSLNELPYAYAAPANATAQQTANAPATASQTVLSQPAAASQAVATGQTVAATQPAAKVIATEAAQTAGTLYAQPTANGYQLIDTTPKKILTLYKTSADDYFIADNGSSNGIVFKRDENWFFEYYRNGKLTAEKLLIKF
ncbi:hypothetical protein [Pedobacter hartonius]|uniref:Uncharacterized protein n=1 Tax=Pedobacter hartonius TaxID=425514 RepID=A0A1H4CWU1_9SPHI|nr:hypothetical protein [Pedobacter hartonius]SEA64933.1 hypothetical protein SAMN05443550_104230 [Pedobacter hartonius]